MVAHAARLRRAWSDGNLTFNCWLTSPSPVTAEALSHVGFDSLLLDLQHGFAEPADVLAVRQATAAGGSALLVRVADSADHATMGRLLDLGVDGIVCPFVNTPEEADSFVRTCTYPPRGHRSWGPFRPPPGMSHSDYFRTSAERIITIAQIETITAIENLNAIARTPGLDALLVGPADLSLSIGQEPIVDYHNERLAEYHRVIGSVAREAGLPLMAIALSDADVPLLVGWGAVALSVASDVYAIVTTAARELSRARAAATDATAD